MNPAFVVVFALFVVALLVMIVAAVRWAVRRDRAARQAQADTGDRPGAPAPDGGSAAAAGSVDTRSRSGEQ